MMGLPRLGIKRLVLLLVAGAYALALLSSTHGFGRVISRGYWDSGDNRQGQSVLGSLGSYSGADDHAGPTDPLEEAVHISPRMQDLQTALAAPPTSSIDWTNPNDYKLYTDAKLRDLAVCAARGDCAKNADKIIIFCNYYSHIAIFAGVGSGEGVWTRSMVQSMHRLGYTTLFAKDDYDYAYHLYRQFPDNVIAVIGDNHNRERKITHVMKGGHRQDGIPAWKFFFYHYWPQAWSGPVGTEWVISAEPPTHDDHFFTYTGYTLPPVGEYIPARERKGWRVWVLAKNLFYFHNMYGNDKPQCWGLDFYKRASDELQAEFPGFEFRGAFTDARSEEEKKAQPMARPEGITWLGDKLDLETFNSEVRNARAMLGIGMPTMSPSGYGGLAVGVPFINPHHTSSSYDHADKKKWGHAQVPGLVDTDEPLVYNVEAHNYKTFVEAIRQALRNPIEPYVLPRMTPEETDKRTAAWLETDWRSKAEVILYDRQNGKETQKCSPKELPRDFPTPQCIKFEL